MKNLGIILICLGALLLILTYPAFKFIPAIVPDMADQNLYTWGGAALTIVGLITHIIVNKKFQ